MKSEDLTQLYLQQLQEFELAKNNFAALNQVVYKNINAEEFSIRLQYNPGRIISTNAKVDPVTLQNKKCFFCKPFMPAKQKGLPYGEHYRILVNPYPIFAPHFTVPENNHIPQLIENRFKDLLDLAFDFQEYTTFYNGPGCGASAPDHFHFQMVPRHLMPLENDVCNEQLYEEIVRQDFYSIHRLKNYLREVIVLRGSDQQLLIRLFSHIQQIIGKNVPFEEEAMFNILAWFDNCQWTICIFPRKQRRPWQFFAEGAEKILFSPGCVDMAGILITPRPEDFNRYSLPLLADLFKQVTIDQNSLTKILQELKKL